MVGKRGLRGIQGIQGIQGKRGLPGVRETYIDAKTFKDFCINQDKLIDILNHRMTTMEGNIGVIKNDVSWTKKLLWAILGVTIVSVTTIISKSIFGI